MILPTKKLAIIFSLLLLSVATFAQSETPSKTAEEATEASDDAAPAASGDGLHSHQIGLGIGQTFLLGDFQDHGEDKITLDFFYGYTASYSFDFILQAHYSKHERKGHYVKLFGITPAIKAKFFQFDNFSPFALGGLGFYSPVVNRPVNNTLKESESKITFGAMAGLGIELKLNNKVSIGSVLQYHNPFDVSQDVGPDVEGSYYKLLLTGMYTF